MDKIQFEYKGTYRNNEYRIVVDNHQFIISGNFYYIKNREIVATTNVKEILNLKDYLGTSNLRIKSERKLNMVLMPYVLASIIKFVITNLLNVQSNIENVNNIVQGNIMLLIISQIMSFIGNFIPIPFPFDIFTVVICLFQLIVIVFLVVYLTSNKDVYEWSFINKRVAVDKNSMSEQVYYKLVDILNFH